MHEKDAKEVIDLLREVIARLDRIVELAAKERPTEPIEVKRR